MTKRTLSCLILVLAIAPSTVAEDGFRIRPHLQNVSQTGATLIWETLEQGRGTVHYAEKGEPHEASAQGISASTIHRIRIENLSPSTAYTYRIQAGNELQTATFVTAPATEREITFVVVGDSRRWGDRWHETEMDEHVKQWNADLFLTMGDLVVDGHQYEQWPEHFARFQELTGSTWFVTARGNHEGSQVRNTESDWFAKYHELPGGEPYAFFDWGNTHFVLISYESTGRKKDWSKSAEWLDAHLEGVDKQYTVVAHHFPVYCTGYWSTSLSRKEPGDRAEDFRDVLDKHDVTLDASGHTHIYERHYPLRGGQRNDRNGTYYVVNGGDINANYPDWWTAVADDRSAMAKPTYTIYLAKEDRIVSRTFAWSKLEKDIVEIDYFIVWKDEAIPQATLERLAKEQGAELVEVIDDLAAMLYAPAAKSLLSYIEHEDASVRHAAAKAIALIANDAIASEVFALLEHSDIKVSAAMARALEVALPESLVDDVARAVLDERIPDRARVHLLGALQFHAPPELTARIMLKILQDEMASSELRMRAVYALGQVATDADLKLLLKAVKNEENSYVFMTLGWKLNDLTGKRVSLSSKGAFAKSAPGERREFVKEWRSK